MSNVLSRACRLFVVLAGLGIGACASPSGPSAMLSGKQAQAPNLASRQHAPCPQRCSCQRSPKELRMGRSWMPAGPVSSPAFPA